MSKAAQTPPEGFKPIEVNVRPVEGFKPIEVSVPAPPTPQAAPVAATPEPATGKKEN
jgi:hypothetical protein